MFRLLSGLSALIGLSAALAAGQAKFSVVAFYTGKNDAAHVAFVNEALQWFPKAATTHGFAFEATNNWSNLNAAYLAKHQVVLFLDTRPEAAAQRDAFKKYMDEGGGWIGFHFAAFALNGSTYPQNWTWYHETFIGAGEYKSNTWKPTSATLRVEDSLHPATAKMPRTWKAAPNEWYAWKNDLRLKPDIKILMSVDPVSFPLGTGPKAHEIWHSGYYPVVWTNQKYRMIYVNMGHNDMDYGGTNQPLSFTFENETQNRFLIESLMWLGGQGTVRLQPDPARAGRLRAAKSRLLRSATRTLGIELLDLQGRHLGEGAAAGVHARGPVFAD